MKLKPFIIRHSLRIHSRYNIFFQTFESILTDVTDTFFNVLHVQTFYKLSCESHFTCNRIMFLHLHRIDCNVFAAFPVSYCKFVFFIYSCLLYTSYLHAISHTKLLINPRKPSLFIHGIKAVQINSGRYIGRILILVLHALLHTCQMD